MILIYNSIVLLAQLFYPGVQDLSGDSSNSFLITVRLDSALARSFGVLGNCSLDGDVPALWPRWGRSWAPAPPWCKCLGSAFRRTRAPVLWAARSWTSSGCASACVSRSSRRDPWTICRELKKKKENPWLNNSPVVFTQTMILVKYFLLNCIIFSQFAINCWNILV